MMPPSKVLIMFHMFNGWKLRGWREGDSYYTITKDKKQVAILPAAFVLHWSAYGDGTGENVEVYDTAN